MDKQICADCKREFQSAESLDQHRQAKHSVQPAGSSVKPKGKISKKLIAAAVILVLIVGIYFVVAGRNSGKGDNKPLVNLSENDDFDRKAFAEQIPKGPIHWHPHVTILIKGQSVTIPADVGLQSSVHKPVHTHDTDNILHWEVDSPTVDNMQLGYFFNTIWKKTFNSQCIFDNCNGPDGTLKMYVNGVENTEFNHYMPKDKDEIKIVFE